LIKKLYPTRF